MSAERSSPTGSSAEPDPGVSLEQYAGITTALTEGFPLEAVLDNEQVAPDAWHSAELAWKTRVARDGTGGALYAELRAKRIVAEDTLARRVAPIDTDLGAWMSFLLAYGAHAAPFEMLDGARIGLNDLSRLQRRWARRMAEDEALPKRAAELAKKGLGPLPPLRVEPAVLERFPWSPGPAPKPAAVVPKVAAPAETSMAPGRVRLFTYVIVKAQLAENPGDEAQVLQKLGMVDFATTDAGWQVILRGDPELERDYRGLLEAQRARIRAAAKQGASAPAAAAPAPVSTAPAPAGIARPPAKLEGTSLAVDVPRKAALPFAERSPDATVLWPTPSANPARVPMPAPQEARLAGTALTVDVPRRSALPFADAAPARQPMPSPPPSTAPPSLTLEQHASLCCEIADEPDRTLETLARYRLTPAQKQATDEHFAERFARERGTRTAWGRAYKTYSAWWRANRVSR